MEKILNKRGYQLDSKISSNVYKVTNKEEIFILKIGNNELIRNEYKVLTEIKMDNISKIHETWEEKEQLFLILEYINGLDLVNYLDTKAEISEQFASDVIFKVIKILMKLQEKGIHYTDVKLENVMLSMSDIILIDFNIISFSNICKNRLGTPIYYSPEKFHGTKFSIEKANSWALGVMLYTLVTDVYPFIMYDDGSVDTDSILKGKYHEFQASENLKDIISKLFEINPAKRIGYEDILKHPFISR